VYPVVWIVVVAALAIGGVLIAAIATAGAPIYALLVAGLALLGAPFYFLAKRMGKTPAPAPEDPEVVRPGGTQPGTGEGEGGTVRQEQRGVA
jgi:hypothetical protein